VHYAARRSTCFATAIILVACTTAESTQESQGSIDRPFTPTQYSVEDFYKNSAFAGASWAPDRQKLLVSSNLSGIWNAYAVPAAGGEPQPLTTSTTNSIYALSYFPADERLLYSSDEGGNELTHIYVRHPNGAVQDLTPGAKLKASFHGWSGDDRSFFVSTNERDPRYFDL
jgi:Tol biopolymer transport system component